MKETFNELIAYLKNPVLVKDENTNTSYRLKKFFHLLIISILTSSIIMPLFGLIESSGLVDMNQHAMEELMEQFPKILIFFLAVILAPVLEELIFRAPLTLFYNQSYFKPAFYTFAILFGLVHITNFTITTNVLLLAPVLVLPQTILGGYLGFIRVKFGLAWSILLHASYNAFFILISFGSDLF
jgi:membrane protease YdiL (CAAX protease family)